MCALYKESLYSVVSYRLLLLFLILTPHIIIPIFFVSFFSFLFPPLFPLPLGCMSRYFLSLNSERDLGLCVELFTTRAREDICHRLHIHEALKYNHLMLCLNKVKAFVLYVCVCVRDSVFVKCKYLKYTFSWYHILSCSHFSFKHTGNHKI